jgi:hypothetical protein
MRNAYRISVGKPENLKVRSHVEDQSVDGKIMWK